MSYILFGTNNCKATNILNTPNLFISGYRFIYIWCHRLSATNLSEMEPNMSIDATIFILLIWKTGMSRRKCLKGFGPKQLLKLILGPQRNSFLYKNTTFQTKIFVGWSWNFYLDAPVSQNFLWLTYTYYFALNRFKWSGTA